MTISPQHQTFPLVSDVHFVARQGLGGPFILARFLDDRGVVIAQSVVDSDRLDSFGRDAMSIAAAARAEDPNVVPIGRLPRTQSCLMPGATPDAPAQRMRQAVARSQPLVMPLADTSPGVATPLVIWFALALGIVASGIMLWIGGNL